VFNRTLKIQDINEENRTIDLAFSSEAPVKRHFGYEILDHNKESIRLNRLQDGAAVLVDHDWSDQVGVIESVTIGPDRKARATIRFGKSNRANEIWQDITDKIRRHVSVGYHIHDLKSEGKRDDTETFRVTDWEPFEVSIVAVPADHTVGINREKPQEEEEMTKPEPQVDAPTETRSVPTVDVESIKESTRKSELDRIQTIAKAGDQFNQRDLATTFIKEGKTVDQFRQALLDNMETSEPLRAMPDPIVGLSDKETRNYSFVKVVRALSQPNDQQAQEDAGLELEASRAAAKKLGRQAQGVIIPADVLNRAVSPINTSTTGTNTGDTGGNLIATDLLSQSFIDILRNRAVMLGLTTNLTGLVGNIDIPRQITDSTGYWLLGEDVDATETGADFDQVSLTPKTVAAFTEITRKMLQQSSLDIEALIRSDLATALALTIDRAVLYGQGTNGEPLGIKNTTGINGVTLSSTSPTFADYVNMETIIASENADVNSMKYLLHPNQRGAAKTSPKFDSTGITIWEPGNSINGYATAVSNQIAAGDVFFGNFKDLILGMWGGLDLTVDPYTHSKKGRLRLVVFQDVDFTIRHPESFCYGAPAPAV